MPNQMLGDGGIDFTGIFVDAMNKESKRVLDEQSNMQLMKQKADYEMGQYQQNLNKELMLRKYSSDLALQNDLAAKKYEYENKPIKETPAKTDVANQIKISESVMGVTSQMKDMISKNPWLLDRTHAVKEVLANKVGDRIAMLDPIQSQYLNLKGQLANVVPQGLSNFKRYNKDVFNRLMGGLDAATNHPEDIVKNIGQIESYYNGTVGSEMPEATGMAKKTIIKTLKSPSTGKIKTIYSDGSEEIK